jgi:hypothetical protein
MAPLTVESRLLRARIEPECAGRVASLTYGGRELLSGPDVHPSNWGSTYWTSPQADWGWPI